MALGGYIAPTINWTQDSQLPDRLEDFKRECLTLFGLELKDANDNAKALLSDSVGWQTWQTTVQSMEH